MKEEELLKKRLMELCEKAYNQNIYTYTHFLNEYEQSIYQDMKQELAYAHPILVGGHKYFTRAVVMFGSHIIGVIKEQLDQVRHTRVFVEEVSWEETGYVQKYKKKEGFVASMRLDVLVSQAFSLSRNISEKLLKSQKVFHNGKMCLSGGQKIKQGDIISVRGYGKFLVEDLGKTSKKGRQFITLAIFQ